MYKSKFLQNVLGEHSSKGSKVGFEDFEDTTPKGFSEKEKTKLTHPDSKKFLHKLQIPESPPDVIKLQPAELTSLIAQCMSVFVPSLLCCFQVITGAYILFNENLSLIS